VLHVCIADGLNLAFQDFFSWKIHQSGVQAPFGVVRFLDRMQLRPQVVRPQEIVRDPQPAGRVAL
jgi:hypothetical protein